MARRRRSAGPQVSLFPFLSILACLIGALTILIVALSIHEILQGRKDETVARAEDYVALERGVREREERIARRQEELQRTNAALVEMSDLQPRIAKVRQDLKKLGELAKQVGKGLPLRILSTSDYYRRVAPVFVEARAEGIVVHSPTKTVVVPRGEIHTHPRFKQTVDYVAAREDRIIVFLVRDDARAGFYAARDFARANGAVTSKVPLQGAGDIDLKEFFRRR